jgi:hypothetical protein
MFGEIAEEVRIHLTDDTIRVDLNASLRLLRDGNRNCRGKEHGRADNSLHGDQGDSSQCVCKRCQRNRMSRHPPESRRTFGVHASEFIIC